MFIIWNWILSGVAWFSCCYNSGKTKVIPITKSPKLMTQIASQKSRKPTGIGTVLVKMSATTVSSPVVVKKHKSANECFSDSSTRRSESDLRGPVNGDFLWSSVFIELTSLQSIGQRAKSMPDPETRPKLLISSEFSKELTICRAANLRVKFRELV